MTDCNKFIFDSLGVVFVINHTKTGLYIVRSKQRLKNFVETN